ncbi:hypothetical protein O3P69_005064 [Scylla paramamosain]|uniref:Uncharacterized protein n=1 Tax=Scylla paramamosain TaxID=85552 RepID=A0AAW0UDT2_SCYPA
MEEKEKIKDKMLTEEEEEKEEEDEEARETRLPDGCRTARLSGVSWHLAVAQSTSGSLQHLRIYRVHSPRL